MEDRGGQVGDLLTRHVARGVIAQGVPRLGIAPSHVAPDVERAIRALGEGGVLVSSEVGERRPGDLHQLEARPPALEIADSGLLVEFPFGAHEVESGEGCVTPLSGEEHLGHREGVRLVPRHDGGREGKVAAGDGDRLHLGIRLQKRAPDLVQPSFQRRRVTGQRCALDEVLHRVRRDDLAVVSLGVGIPERVPTHGDRDLGTHQQVVTATERGLRNPRHAP